MSKILKALEKAEQAERRASNSGGIIVSDDYAFLPDSHDEIGPAALRETPAPSPRPKTAENRPRSNVEVHYNKTKVAPACFHKMEERRILSATAPSSLRDAFNVLRTQILQQTRVKGLNTIMVTSPGRAEGKTTVATNLAITIARDASQTALLVDANLRWPGISCSLGMESLPGLSDHFLRGLAVESLFVSPGIDKLVLLPAGASHEDSVDIISSPDMQKLVAEMKSRYPDRYVIFDCPHLLGIPDALAFGEYVDGIILVVEEGATKQGDFKAALEMLEGRNLLGIVLNKI